MVDVVVEIEGLDAIIDKFGGMPAALRTSLARAGKRYAPELLNVRGVRNYPPTTAANLPPVPYYIRGVGTQGALYNDNSSEQYGARFTIETREATTIIGNTASYAKYLAGATSQARVMAKIGWKKLITAAQETKTQLMRIYTEEVDNALRSLRLK